MKKNIVIAALILIISLYVLFRAGLSYLDDYNYTKESSSASPNGYWLLTEFQSMSEGGHAPYGQYLSLTRKSEINTPEKGYVVFAGYCDNTFGYEWKSDELVLIKCKPDEGKNILTISKAAFGVRFEVASP